jgi:hypothetical protein
MCFLQQAGRGLGMLTLWALPWAAHAECLIPPGAPSSASEGPVQARWTTEPPQVQVGEPFVMRVALCPAGAKLLRVDATMPEHRHGMNYRSSVKPLGNGLWQVEGMVWHMAGRWELRLDTELDGVPHKLAPSVMLK